jgi:hypothetical protein
MPNYIFIDKKQYDRGECRIIDKLLDNYDFWNLKFTFESGHLYGRPNTMVIDVEEDSAFEPLMEAIRENTDGFSMVKDVGTHNFETWSVISTADWAIDDIKEKCWVESGYVLAKPENYKLLMLYDVYCDYYLFGHDSKKNLKIIREYEKDIATPRDDTGDYDDIDLEDI